MHPSILDDLGLAAALQRLADDLRDHVLVQLTSIAAPKDLAPDAALCLYRVAQEGLRNVIRHAATGSASIRIETTRGGVALEVVDHGRGLRVTDRSAGSGLGLRSLTERARLLQGELTVDSIPGRGTTVRVWLPLNV
jgi:signal transduction histidine kinase